MQHRQEKIVGIVGGMGPESTIDLMTKIFAATPAVIEQDHLHLIVDSNPKTPDRTKFILDQGESPVPTICQGIKRVIDAGADFIMIPCNTAHAFIEELKAASSVPLLDMLELTAEFALRRYGPGAKLGLLATRGTILSGAYEIVLRDRGLETIVPSVPNQEELMQAIYGPHGIKLGYLKDNAVIVERLGRELIDKGAQAVICGCTEVGLVLDKCDFPVIDPLTILAAEAVRIARNETD